jgi:hypothetical protein
MSYSEDEEQDLKVNAEKSKFCTGELEYLGYWITGRYQTVTR